MPLHQLVRTVADSAAATFGVVAADAAVESPQVPALLSSVGLLRLATSAEAEGFRLVAVELVDDSWRSADDETKLIGFELVDLARRNDVPGINRVLDLAPERLVVSAVELVHAETSRLVRITRHGRVLVSGSSGATDTLDVIAGLAAKVTDV